MSGTFKKQNRSRLIAPSESGASIFQRRKRNLGKINNGSSEGQDDIMHTGHSRAESPEGLAPGSCFSQPTRPPFRVEGDHKPCLRAAGLGLLWPFFQSRVGSRVLTQGLARSAPCPPPGFTSSPPASAPHAALSPGPLAETSYTGLSTVICEAPCLFPWIFSTTMCVSYLFQLPSLYFFLHWVFVVIHKLSLVAMSGLSGPVACGILVP